MTKLERLHHQANSINHDLDLLGQTDCAFEDYLKLVVLYWRLIMKSGRLDEFSRNKWR